MTTNLFIVTYPGGSIHAATLPQVAAGIELQKEGILENIVLIKSDGIWIYNSKNKVVHYGFTDETKRIVGRTLVDVLREYRKELEEIIYKGTSNVVINNLVFYDELQEVINIFYNKSSLAHVEHGNPLFKELHGIDGRAKHWREGYYEHLRKIYKTLNKRFVDNYPANYYEALKTLDEILENPEIYIRDWVKRNTKQIIANLPKFYEMFDVVVGVSRYTEVQVKGINPSTNTTVIYNGFFDKPDTNSIPEDRKNELNKTIKNILENNEIVFHYGGRIAPEKGLPELLLAIIGLRRRGVKVALALNGWNDPKWNIDIRKLPQGTVYYIGNLNQAEFYYFMQKLKEYAEKMGKYILFYGVGRDEQYGISIAEAVKNRLPVILSEDTAPHEFIENAVVVPIGEELKEIAKMYGASIEELNLPYQLLKPYGIMYYTEEILEGGIELKTPRLKDGDERSKIESWKKLILSYI